MPEPPRLPDEMLLRYTDVAEGRIRSRVLGRPQPDPLPLVVVQGMAVSDYLLPACAALGSWTEVHLFDVPGFGGSGQPTRHLDVRGYGEAVVHWLQAKRLDRGLGGGGGALGGGTEPGPGRSGRPLQRHAGGRVGRGAGAGPRRGGGPGQPDDRPDRPAATEADLPLALGRPFALARPRGEPPAGVEARRYRRSGPSGQGPPRGPDRGAGRPSPDARSRHPRRGRQADHRSLGV